MDSGSEAGVPVWKRTRLDDCAIIDLTEVPQALEGERAGANVVMPDTRAPGDDDSVTWLGHATARIEIDGVTILTDPLLRSNIGPVRRYAPAPARSSWQGINLVLISHLHRDHLDVESLLMLGVETPLVVPMGAGRLLEQAGFVSVTELAEGDVTRVGPLTVTATFAAHSGFRPPAGPWALAIGFLVEGSRSFYFAGDTDLCPQLNDLPPVDVALLPVGGWGPTLRGGHMNPERAASALEMIEPRLAIPVHWGTFWPAGFRWLRPHRFATPGHEFAAHAARSAPAVEVRVLRPGERTPAATDLPPDLR